MKYVAQLHRDGCGIACMAMVLGKTYEDVRRQFGADFNKSGLDSETVKEFVCRNGFAVIEKSCGSYLDIGKMNGRMREPFADVHIVSVWRFADTKVGHWVVMDRKGNLYDPATKGLKEWNYYSIDMVLGFYREV